MLPPTPFKVALLSTRFKHTTSDLSLVFMIYIIRYQNGREARAIERA